MTLDRQYIFNCKIALGIPTTVINKSQTLCAITMSNYVCIFSMESGVLISEFHDDGWYYFYNTYSIFLI